MPATVVIKKFRHRHEAQLAKNILAEEGIEAIISADDCGGQLDITNAGVGIVVNSQDALRAKEILTVLGNS